MNFLYQIGIHLFILFLRIVALFNAKIKEGIDGRKSWTSALDKIPENTNVIWFHCASLGEFDQGLPVMNELKKRHPKSFLLVTFFSPSGMNHYHKRAHSVDLAMYLPFDTKGNVRLFLNKVNPSLAVFVKYEFWPNFVLGCKHQDKNHFDIDITQRQPNVL